MEYACSACGMPAGDTTHEGLFVESGWGSAHDTTTFIWLVPVDLRPKPGILCDACIDAHLAAGRLEAISRHVGEQPQPSLEARRRLFELGAQKAADAFWQRHGDRPYAALTPDGELERAVIEARREMRKDKDEPGLVGAAHARAAIAHGLANADPGFVIASARWARAISRQPHNNPEADEEALLRAFLEIQEIESDITGP